MLLVLALLALALSGLIFVLRREHRHQKQSLSQSSSVNTAPQFGPYRTADVIAGGIKKFVDGPRGVVDLYYELQAKYKHLQDVVTGFVANSDKEMWRQGMLDAAALVRSRNYLIIDPRLDRTRDIIDHTRDALEKIIKRHADYPEESIIPMLPISPHAARKVGTLK